MNDKTLNQLAADAIKALSAFNAANEAATKAWNANKRAGGYAAHFKQCPQISDDLQMQLLEEIVFHDDDAKGTLDELRLQIGVDADGFALTDCFGLDVNSSASRHASRVFDSVGQ